MKIKITYTALFLSLTLGSFSQGIEKREIGPFNKLEVSGTANVIFRHSDTLSLNMEGAAEEMKNIETRVENNTLYIHTKGNFEHPFKIYVSGNDLKQLSVSGASRFRSTNVIRNDSMEIETSGASNVEAGISSSSLRTTVSGASELRLNGTSQNFYANLSGAAHLKAYKLQSQNATVITSGASSAKVFAAQKLVANASGASNIKFQGDPKEVTAEGSTTAQIMRIVDDEAYRVGSKRDSSRTSFMMGNKTVIIVDNGHEPDTFRTYLRKGTNHKHWEGFFMGVNGYVNPNQSFTMEKPHDFLELDYNRCLNFQINFSQYNVHLYKRYINLVTGVGYEHNQYELLNNITLNPDASFTSPLMDSTGISNPNFRKNRLKTHFVTVPLLLDFNTSKRTRDNFHISLGVIGKYLFASRTRQVYHNNSDKFVNARYDSYNLNPFRFDAYASIGYRDLTLYAQYALNTMFKNNKGPEVYPFSVGIRLLPFD